MGLKDLYMPTVEDDLSTIFIGLLIAIFCKKCVKNKEKMRSYLRVTSGFRNVFF